LLNAMPPVILNGSGATCEGPSLPRNGPGHAGTCFNSLYYVYW
jgi:hypothetical protein